MRRSLTIIDPDDVIKKRDTYMDWGLKVKEANWFDQPEKDLEFVSIPGRNGDFVVNNGRYKNMEIEYTFSLQHPQAYEKLNKITSELQSVFPTKYLKLVDSVDPAHYRFGIWTGEISVNDITDYYIEMTLGFNCKPLRYERGVIALKISSGVIVDASSSLDNHTQSTAKPIVSIIPNSVPHEEIPCVLITNDTNLNIRYPANADYMLLDSEKQVCFASIDARLQNYSSSISGTFPILGQGENTMTLQGLDATVKIEPRWMVL